MGAFLYQHLAIDDGHLDTRGLLNQSLLAARQVAHHLRLALADRRRIEERQIRRHSRTQQTAIMQTENRRNHKGKLAHALFQTHHVPFANPVAEQTGSIAVAGVVNEMRAGI